MVQSPVNRAKRSARRKKSAEVPPGSNVEPVGSGRNGSETFVVDGRPAERGAQRRSLSRTANRQHDATGVQRLAEHD
jgi:hypothetical protein